ncbi:MAG TPA: thioredoxin domain-containing protein, partial [Tepidisphaeraceae bacterium]|nr:thioredoxin domain-containing protein [Tepidisphaeraceae bacterium]
MATPEAKYMNRLAKETSPYLLQHAHNPVDWHAWGAEAFEEARKQNKPIFLSVGYSTCYWCHVMERQSFENEQIAREMNERFINIKVDREERPDVDQLYMTAVQVLTRHGGWPMSVWLTPDLRPFYGGTYFPPVDQGGRPGFMTVMRAIEGAYRDRPGDVEKTASQLVNILRQVAEPQAPESPVTIGPELIEEILERSVGDYESQFGGFGSAPKFPRQTLLELMLVHNRHVPNERRMKMLRHALDAMADGGIRDHLGGGFHRYSTDAKWLVPHFEIMLYDNAMLAWVYVEAFRQTKEKRYADVARGILDFVLREMTSPEGGFYTAIDAEVDAMEGLSYLWTLEEVRLVLGEETDFFAKVYGLDRGPNFADPHHGTGQADKNILYLPRPLAEVAGEMRISADDLEAKLRPLRQRLYEARRKREQPLLDTKIITSWNALMIRGMAYAGRILGEKRYVETAAKAGDFLWTRHRHPGGGLWRTSREGVTKHFAFLDDYAFLAQAYLELKEASGDERWGKQAREIAAKMQERFGDKESGGFYFTAQGQDDLIVRQKVASDSPLPSGNAVAVIVMLELRMMDVARDTLEVFANQLELNGEGMSSMVEAAIFYLRGNGPISVAPGPWRGNQGGRPQT